MSTMIVCNAAACPDPDRRVRDVANQALRALQADLQQGADEIGQLDEHIRALIKARRKPRRPDFDAVRHVCLAAITLQMSAGLYRHISLFGPCPDPHACRLEDAARLLLAGYEGDHHFVMGMASARAQIWPLQ
jgi:hypothetical protein